MTARGSNGRRPHRNTLSVCLIVRDEEDVLARCLDSMKIDGRPIWDELIIGIDSRTKDATPDIAEEYGARVIHIRMPDDNGYRDFATARNIVGDAAKGDYLWWIDADEILINGHQKILDTVYTGRIDSIRPCIVYSRDEHGKKLIYYPRQDMLYRRGAFRWRGRVHEWTVRQGAGPEGIPDTDIEVEQLERPGGDRPHGDAFELLRLNFADCKEEIPWPERHMFYLAREHAGKEGHEQEGIALVESMLKHSDPSSPIQRSHACIIAAEMCARIGETQEARNFYIEAIKQWGVWAEPYYALGVFVYELGIRHMKDDRPREVFLPLFIEASGWLLASTVYSAPAYFVDMTVYSWRRYQALAVALARIGKLHEAHIWTQRAMAAEPDSEDLKEQLRIINEALDAIAKRDGVAVAEGVQ